ncbi:unnamed protein product [Rotaria socialis]|uniref:Uncharacterized protein n=1 Tax=Rotaria socialis TaxID=392032 RepID=A0A817SYZ1_9BILA|nr:unnamed protein product [Rotaria socialis]CAF3309594.1 unnamed protein product [Rotaria socialis]CAF3550056.1 unnamed protein product [Rotaria socialis]CAF3583669.1 unnamed protein product [Rotaria socialis]CAF3681293.1 unnamed protein product [Rotaria socialis]
MLYNSQQAPKKDWSSTVQYQSYTPDKRVTKVWLFALAIVLLTLSVAALVIVFSVEHNWFYDSYNITQTNNGASYTIHYGLWRLCFYANQTCASWFSNDPPHNLYVEQRLQQAQVGINAWQALEIVFLFLTASTLIIALVAIIYYKFDKTIHYYLAVLTGFCIWPAAAVGISSLFVFGFSVYGVAVNPKGLDWCFYVNIAAVALSIIGAIALTIYDILLKKPIKTDDNDTVIGTFMGINDYPADLNPPTVVAAKRHKKQQRRPYDHQDMFYPNPYYPGKPVNISNTDYVTNPNHQMLAPYTSLTNNEQINPAFQQQVWAPYRGSSVLHSPSANSMPPQPWQSQPPTSSYPYEPPYWHRPAPNPMNYHTEPVNEYVQRGLYRPNRLNPMERTFDPKEEPRVLHYYTGHNEFSAVDPADAVSPRNSASLQGPNSGARYNANPSYYQQKVY